MDALAALFGLDEAVVTEEVHRNQSHDENDYAQLRKDAFVGDARFSAAVCEALYREYPNETVGDLSERKALLISNAAMASLISSALPGITLPEHHNHHEEQTHAEGTLFECLFFRIETESDRRACVKRWMSYVYERRSTESQPKFELIL
jgi:hypothetical protein